MNDKINEFEVIWVASGIRGLLLSKMDKEDFPHDFYEEAKKLIGYGNKR